VLDPPLDVSQLRPLHDEVPALAEEQVEGEGRQRGLERQAPALDQARPVLVERLQHEGPTAVPQ
jgi:hypothetical protein